MARPRVQRRSIYFVRVDIMMINVSLLRIFLNAGLTLRKHSFIVAGPRRVTNTIVTKSSKIEDLAIYCSLQVGMQTIRLFEREESMKK